MGGTARLCWLFVIKRKSCRYMLFFTIVFIYHFTFIIYVVIVCFTSFKEWIFWLAFLLLLRIYIAEVYCVFLAYKDSGFIYFLTSLLFQIIYICRNPKDVAVSYFRYLSWTEMIHDEYNTMDLFVDKFKDGLCKLYLCAESHKRANI